MTVRSQSSQSNEVVDWIANRLLRGVDYVAVVKRMAEFSEKRRRK